MLRLIALGHTNAEIAEQLYLSVRTVETHRSHIQQKLRLSTRAELVGYALERGLISTGAGPGVMEKYPRRTRGWWYPTTHAAPPRQTPAGNAAQNTALPSSRPWVGSDGDCPRPGRA